MAHPVVAILSGLIAAGSTLLAPDGARKRSLADLPTPAEVNDRISKRLLQGCRRDLEATQKLLRELERNRPEDRLGIIFFTAREASLKRQIESLEGGNV